jgi:hypothetical protein
VADRAPIRVLAFRIVVSCLAVLALRWHVPLASASLRGGGAIDATVAAFHASFALGLAGLPGFVSALWRLSDPRSWWIRAGLVATLVSSLATILWLATSMRAIGGTLPAGTIAGALAPPLATAAAAVALRLSVARITSR